MERERLRPASCHHPERHRHETETAEEEDDESFERFENSELMELSIRQPDSIDWTQKRAFLNSQTVDSSLRSEKDTTPKKTVIYSLDY